jgi:acyl-CoA synthetase (AMP-forming)/AMP-acid ligase II
VVANIMTMVRCAGALIIMPEFKAAEYLKMAARERVTYTVMVPAMYNLCLLQPDFDSYDLSSWRIGGFGGAPMPIATIERLDAKIPGLKLLNCYGATETTSPSTMMPGELTASHIDSVGLPCPGAQIVVMDAQGRELPRGEIGEIWIHGGSVIKGYWNNPKATAESFTGRLLAFRRSRLDRCREFRPRLRSPEGHDQPRRTEDLFGGGRVGAGWPSLTWSRARSSPNRARCWASACMPVVVTRNAVGAEVLRAWCAERLSDYKVPETMDVRIGPLPRNANGKVMKRQLREAFMALMSAQRERKLRPAAELSRRLG